MNKHTSQLSGATTW